MGGLRMIDPYAFSLAQKMAWVKLLLDDNYNSAWKSIELSFLNKFNAVRDILWKSYAPELILNKLKCAQLADSIRTWYLFRDKACMKEFGNDYLHIGSSQCIWFNKNIRSKSKKYFFYQEWFEKGIMFISDLLNPPHPDCKIFEELVLDFHVSPKDRRNYNFLLQNIPGPWLNGLNIFELDVHSGIVKKLIESKKIPKYAYTIFFDECHPDKSISFWKDSCSSPTNVDWGKIHMLNFKCTIDSRLRSFYFKIFHRTIALNAFLFKIKRKDSPNCSFCNQEPETIIHIFGGCPVVNRVWDELLSIINQKQNSNITVSLFEKMFGIQSDNFLTFIFLALKYYIHCCKFNDKTPNTLEFRARLKVIQHTEYFISKKRGKLPIHFKKWRFAL